jgi:hypothetical protein
VLSVTALTTFLISAMNAVLTGTLVRVQSSDVWLDPRWGSELDRYSLGRVRSMLKGC